MSSSELSPTTTWPAPKLEDLVDPPRCGVCGRLMFFAEPDPTTCGECVVAEMAKVRRLLRAIKLRATGPFHGLDRHEGARVAPDAAPAAVLSGPRPDLLPVTSGGPEASSVAEGRRK